MSWASTGSIVALSLAARCSLSEPRERSRQNRKHHEADQNHVRQLPVDAAARLEAAQLGVDLPGKFSASAIDLLARPAVVDAVGIEREPHKTEHADADREQRDGRCRADGCRPPWRRSRQGTGCRRRSTRSGIACDTAARRGPRRTRASATKSAHSRARRRGGSSLSRTPGWVRPMTAR